MARIRQPDAAPELPAIPVGHGLHLAATVVPRPLVRLEDTSGGDTPTVVEVPLVVLDRLIAALTQQKAALLRASVGPLPKWPTQRGKDDEA